MRESNIVAAKAVADAVRTSLGPRGMDKMISSPKGEVVITNDGATILKQMEVSHPTAKMLVDLSKSQDIEAGDGTTTVTVIAGALLNAAQTLLEKGIHPTVISESFLMAAKKSEEILQAMSVPVDLADREQLIRAASTSLNSKVISNNAGLHAPLAVDAILKIIDPATAVNCDLRDIKVVKKMGGTIDDTELVDGLVFAQKASHAAGGPTKIANAKIGLVQFCLSAPKTDIEQNIVVSDYSQMDRILKEERKYILDMCKKISKSGCNVLLIQKSILRDAVNELSLHFLAKMKILVVKDIEREDVEFICKTCGCMPIANVETVHAEKLGKADLVQEETTSEGKIVRVSGVPLRPARKPLRVRVARPRTPAPWSCAGWDSSAGWSWGSCTASATMGMIGSGSVSSGSGRCGGASAWARVPGIVPCAWCREGEACFDKVWYAQ